MHPLRILLLRSLPLERDSRSTKMVSEYRRRGHDTTALVWSRGDPIDDQANTIICEVPSGYGRKLRGLAARARWMGFMAKQMVLRRHEYDVVHTVDFDTAIVSVPLGRILKKTVVYDAFDSIGAMLVSGAVSIILSKLERWWIRAASIAIFPDPIRLQQYGIIKSEKTAFIGNIPETSDYVAEPVRYSEGPLRIVYIGTLEADHRGLEYIPRVCDALLGKIEFIVGGTGNLHEYFLQQCAERSNLTYIGYQSYDKALQHMADADVLYGPYLLSTPAHRYASPNKMYEHLVLGRPLLTNIGTPPATLVNMANSGFLFDGSCEGLQILLASLDREHCRSAGARARRCWDDAFSTLRNEQLERFFTLLQAETVSRNQKTH